MCVCFFFSLSITNLLTYKLIFFLYSFLLYRSFSAAHKDAHHHDGGHHDHHDHRVFHPEEWNPFGPPLAILVTVVGGGTAIIYTAYSLQMSKWTQPK